MKRTDIRAQEKRQQRAPFVLLVFVLGLLGFWVCLGLLVKVYFQDSEVKANMSSKVATFQAENTTNETDGVVEKHFELPPVLRPVFYGQTLGVLHVPSWDGMEIPVAEGTGVDVLDLGYAGHHENTQLPGQIGNSVLAGHRLTKGSNFQHIDELKTGDELIVETSDTYIVYTVTGHEIVNPDQVEILASVPGDVTAEPTKSVLTIYSCHPLDSSAQRYVVYADFSYWTSKNEGKPEALQVNENN